MFIIIRSLFLFIRQKEFCALFSFFPVYLIHEWMFLFVSLIGLWRITN